MALQKDVLPLHAWPWIRRALGGGTPQSTRMADAPRLWIHRSIRYIDDKIRQLNVFRDQVSISMASGWVRQHVPGQA